MENAALAAKLWPNIAKGAADECWPWKRGGTENGYGRTKLAGQRERLAHRLIWVATNGPIPDGLCVLHQCDNPPCCNPAHLWLGTHTENCRDRDAKGRNVVARGTQSVQCVLTEEQITAARADPRGCITVARELGVSITTVWKVRSGTWGGLPKAPKPSQWVRSPGESNGSAKLTTAEVLAIRADARAAPIVARDYGVCVGRIYAIRARTTWKRV